MQCQASSRGFWAVGLLPGHGCPSLSWPAPLAASQVYVRPLAAGRRTVGADAAAAAAHGGDGMMSETGDELGAAPGGAAGGAGGALGNASGGRGVYAFYFNIGSVDSFEHAMEEAQEALGVPPARHVPILYTTEVSWQQELWRLLPTILLIGGYVWFTRRQLGGLGGPGGGPGGRGIFNVGKASVSARPPPLCMPCSPYSILGWWTGCGARATPDGVFGRCHGAR